ncbi:hypothetical protein BHE74_00028067 [Ensete ventricosum]|nr:hypothetical protein BHE74_00028067 [Ensete ventricosum]
MIDAGLTMTEKEQSNAELESSPGTGLRFRRCNGNSSRDSQEACRRYQKLAGSSSKGSETCQEFTGKLAEDIRSFTRSSLGAYRRGGEIWLVAELRSSDSPEERLEMLGDAISERVLENLLCPGGADP